MIGLPLPPHPLLLDPTPLWPEPDEGESDDLRVARGIMLAVILGCAFWGAVAVAWAWLVWLS